MEKKRDFYVRASSLGSYFGVGFNTPEQQYLYDTGQEEVVFDDDALARMRLGVVFEDTILDYFEEVLGVIITDRNTETINFYEGKLRGRLDGRTIYHGAPSVVEAKMSNSNYKNFIDNLGYHLQVQAYMMDDPEIQTAILLGLQNGRPIFKVIYRDEEMIEDIKTMIDFLIDYNDGVKSWSEYPSDLLEKYSGTKPLPEIETMPDEDVERLKTIARLKEEIKVLDSQLKYHEGFIKDQYSVGKFDNGNVSVTLSEYSRKGGYDINRFMIEYPEIDMEQYRQEPTYYRTLRVKVKQ